MVKALKLKFCFLQVRISLILKAIFLVVMQERVMETLLKHIPLHIHHHTPSGFLINTHLQLFQELTSKNQRSLIRSIIIIPTLLETTTYRMYQVRIQHVAVALIALIATSAEVRRTF